MNFQPLKGLFSIIIIILSQPLAHYISYGEICISLSDNLNTAGEFIFALFCMVGNGLR